MGWIESYNFDVCKNYFRWPLKAARQGSGPAQTSEMGVASEQGAATRPGDVGTKLSHPRPDWPPGLTLGLTPSRPGPPHRLAGLP